MKITKPAASMLGGCGVWLDTTDLRVKKKKPRLIRPISKLLNPLATSGGYSVSVALSFTQTKLQMPVTKQSSISSFFGPVKRTGGKPAVCPEPCSDPTSTVAPAVNSGSNWKCSRSGEDFAGGVSSLDRLGGENSKWHAETDCLEDQQGIFWTTEHPAPLHVTSEKEEEPSFRNKREFGGCFLPRGPETQEECSSVAAESLWCDSQANGGLLHEVLHSQRRGNNGSLPGNLDSEGAFGGLLLLEGWTSTQRRHPGALSGARERGVRLRKEEEKENNWGRSPLKLRPSPSPLPLSCGRERIWLSPQKQVPVHHLETETDTYAALFTQDSQGHRVIAHRSFQTRTPLKDHTNWASSIEAGSMTLTVPPVTLLEEDSDLQPKMLFTQDSQGNMVIKH